jgi:hypothetical protein
MTKGWIHMDQLLIGSDMSIMCDEQKGTPHLSASTPISESLKSVIMIHDPSDHHDQKIFLVLSLYEPLLCTMERPRQAGSSSTEFQASAPSAWGTIG